MKMKNTTQQPFKKKWTVPIDNDGQIHLAYGLRREKACLRGVVNNTGTDQPTHPRSLISAFVIPFLENIISRLATSEISIF